MSSKSRRVLLLSACKPGGFSSERIHMGLSLLGEILVNHGHEVKLVDYSYLQSIWDRSKAPSVADLIQEFKPEIVGISVFTYLFADCLDLVHQVAACSDAVVMLGGPHFAVFPDEFAGDTRVSYVFRGEAELDVVAVVERAQRQPKPVYIDCKKPAASDVPPVNLDIAVGSQYLRDYQIQLSRGCPYNCTFCNVDLVAGHRMRMRDVKACLAQIVAATRRYPSIRKISITDDCPMIEKALFKAFLKDLAAADLHCELCIDNVRANFIDEELLELLRRAGGRNICLGVESGDPDVFEMVNKGQTLQQIEAAARLVKKFNLMLGLCFVIGLPGDTLRRHRNSVVLARRLRPDYVFWNMCIPWPGTPNYEWFKKNGVIGDPRNVSTLVDPRAQFSAPTAATKEFPLDDRIKAWLGANLSTHKYFNNPRIAGRVFMLALQYRLYREYLWYVVHCLIPGVMEYMKFLPVGVMRRLRLSNKVC